jgi:hypothetical protein
MVELSPSEMNMFHNMGQAYRLIKIMKLPTQPVDNYKRDLGINMHLIIKKYYLQVHQKPTVEFIERTAKQCFTTYFDQTLNMHHAEATVALNNFIAFEKRRLDDYRVPVLVETYLKQPNMYKGIIDMFDGVTVYDWKLKNVMKMGDNERTQSKTYTTLLHANDFKIPDGYNDFKFKFVPLLTKTEIDAPFTTDAWLEQRRQNVLNGIATDTYPECNKYLCPWCDAKMACEFRKSKLWESVDLLWNRI